jgi:hypothetical protein
LLVVPVFSGWTTVPDMTPGDCAGSLFWELGNLVPLEHL